MRQSTEVRVWECYGLIKNPQEILIYRGDNSEVLVFLQRNHPILFWNFLVSEHPVNMLKRKHSRMFILSKGLSRNTSKVKVIRAWKRFRGTNMMGGLFRRTLHTVKISNEGTNQTIYGSPYGLVVFHKDVSTRNVASLKVLNIFFLHQ